MTMGPGKYDEETTKVREETGAGGVILIVFGGNEGSGFSVQAPVHIQKTLPSILRNLAGQIEQDLVSMGFDLNDIHS